MSLVGSFTTHTASFCFVKETLPSRNGGFMLWTISRTRVSSTRRKKRGDGGRRGEKER